MSRRATVRILLAAACVIGVIAIRAIPDIAPESDFALLDLGVLNLLHGSQSVGPYSRFGWNHPGPLYFQFLAPLYLLSGYRHLSVLVGAAVLNSICLVGALAILRRHASLGTLISGGAVFGVYLVRAWGLLASPWNAHVPILSLALLLLCSAAAAAGRYSLLPVATGIASFNAQTYIGFAPSSVAILVLTFASVAYDHRRSQGRSPHPGTSLTSPILVSTMVVVAVWALPLADQFRPDGSHNLEKIFGFFRTQESGRLRELRRDFADFFIGPFAPRLTLPWGTPLTASRDRTPAVLAESQTVLLCFAIWWYRRRPFEMRLAGLTIGASLAALVSVARLPDHPNNHSVYWVSILGVISWILILAPVFNLILTRGRASRPTIEGFVTRWVLAASIVAVLSLSCLQIKQSYRALSFPSRWIVRLADMVRQRLDRGDVQTPLVHLSPDVAARTAGLVLQLARGGIRLTVDPAWVYMFGHRFEPTGHESLAIQLVREGDHLEEFRHRSDYEFLGSVTETFVYAIHPPPAARPFEEPIRVVGASGSSRPDAYRLVDGRWLPTADGELPSGAIFAGMVSSVTIEMPRGPIIGVRLWGQQATTWDLSCSVDGRAFDHIGRIRIPDGAGPTPGDTYPRVLGSCRQVTIAPAVDGAWTLREVQVLIPSQRHDR